MSEVGKNFIFVHIFKCAGNSVKKTLRDYDNTSKEPLGAHSDIWDIYLYHKKNKEVNTFNNKFKFVIVRNPYDWLASTYFYIKRAKKHPYWQKMNQISINGFVDWYVNEAMQTKNRYGENKYLTLRQFIAGQRRYYGEIMVDYIAKVENLENDWKVISNNIGLDNSKLPVLNRNPNQNSNYRDLFNAQAKETIKNVFKRDFELFNYRK